LSFVQRELRLDNAALQKISTKNHVCPCCNGCLSGNLIHDIASAINSIISQNGMFNSTIGLNVVFPPVLDVSRLAARTIVTGSTEKHAPFPTLAELFYRRLAFALKSTMNIVELKDARIRVCFKLHKYMLSRI
jgi:hypothetical protein